MVATTFTYPGDSAQWLRYLLISIGINLLIISAISLSVAAERVDVQMLKVNLMALAKPAPEVVRQQPQKTANAAQPVLAENVAPKEVAVAAYEPESKSLVTEERPVQVTPVSDSGKELSNVIHEANYRRQTPPVYPRRAMELGQQGTVTLHAKVQVDGYPGDLKIEKSSGHRLLDMAAVAAVKEWEFEPTNINGDAITSWVRVPVRFVLEK